MISYVQNNRWEGMRQGYAPLMRAAAGARVCAAAAVVPLVRRLMPPVAAVAVVAGLLALERVCAAPMRQGCE